MKVPAPPRAGDRACTGMGRGSYNARVGAESVAPPEVPLETSLYPPVKRFLESLGFTVKGEIGRCDVVGLKGDAPPVVVICELKQSFNLELVLQGIDRAAISDEVWLAARLSTRGRGRESDARFRNLCRRLGFGLLGITGSGRAEILLSPEAQMPRRNAGRRSRLIEEHRRRRGDPVAGGGARAPVMTAYRQRALACAAAMAEAPQRPRDIRTAIPDAPQILLRNVYGWFVRIERGLYGLTEAGHAALRRWPQPRPPGSAGCQIAAPPGGGDNPARRRIESRGDGEDGQEHEKASCEA